MLPSTLYVFCIALNPGCWKGTEDIHGFGGSSHNLATLAECQAACISDRACVAIDWEPSNVAIMCWTLTLPYTGPARQPGFIIHYELNRTCAGEFCFCYTKCRWRGGVTGKAFGLAISRS